MRCPACRTISCSRLCSRRRTGCAPSTPATSRARPIWRWARRWRPASRRPTPWCRARGCSMPRPRCSPPIAMNAPVLGLIGQIPDADIGRDLGHLHEIRDQAGIIKRLVDHSALIRKPEQASRATALAHAGDANRPAGTGGARMRHRRLGQIRAGDARRRRCRVPATKIDARRDPQGGKTPRRGEAAADHLRRRRARRFRGSHRAVRHAAGAGARLSPRPRRARRPRSVQRHAAARPRSVGRGRRGAGGRHAAPDSVPAMGHRPKIKIVRVDADAERARPPAQARGGADRRCRTDPGEPACRIADAQCQARLAQGRDGGAPGGVAQALAKKSRRRSPSSMPSAPNCPRTASSSTRSRRSALLRASPIRSTSRALSVARLSGSARLGLCHCARRPARAAGCAGGGDLAATAASCSPPTRWRPRSAIAFRSPRSCSMTAPSATCAASSRSTSATG